MSRPRGHSLRGRRDEGEPAIVEALLLVGAVVRQLNGQGLPDLLVGHNGRWSLLEVKGEIGPRGGKSKDGQKLGKAQQLFRLAAMAAAGCPVHVVRSPAEALGAIGIGVVPPGVYPPAR